MTTAPSIYRRLLERDEYANGGTTITAKTLYSAAAGVPAVGQTRVTVTFEDGLGNVLKTETHDFQGDPTASASIPSDPTYYSGWNDGLEFESNIIDPAAGTLEARQVSIGQRPCDLSIDSASCILQGNSDVPSSYPPRDPQMCEVNTTLGALGSGPTSWVTFGYDKYNNQTDQREFDFGSAPAAGFAGSCPAGAGGYLRDTATAYKTDSSYTNTPASVSGTASQPYLVSLPVSRIVSDASGTAAKDLWAYDGSAIGGASGEPGHDDSNYPASNTVRGNVSQHTVYNTASSMASEVFAYDQTGSLTSQGDFNGNTTTFGYNDSTNPAHVNPTTVATALDTANGWHTSYAYDPNTLKATSVTDENSNTTSYTYESAANTLDRLSDVQRGQTIHSHTSYVYGVPTSPSVTAKQDQVNPGDGAIQTETDYDLFGRPVTTTQYEASGSISATQSYDALGKISQTTAPSRSGDGLNYPTTYSYDALGRPLKVLTVDGSQTTVSYTGATATITDAAGKARRNTIDGLGRLKEVEEDPSGLGYVTQYAYNGLDNITTVTQGSQTRSFGWNMRGWQTSATNPEQSAPTSLSYDNNGNVNYRQDARGIETCYQYDSVNRITLQVYFTGAEAATCSGTLNNTSGPYTPNVTYSYDSGTNARGRLVSVWNGTVTDGITGYDELGRITGNSQTVGGLGAQSIYYYYNKADEVYQIVYPTGRAVNNTFDVAGRMSGVTGVIGSASTPYAAASCAGSGCQAFAPSGMPNGLTYGNGLTRTYGYNNRLQPSSITDALSGSTLFSLNYTFGTSSTNNGNPTQVVIGGTGGPFTQTYGYDSLNRLSSFADSGGASQTLSHDRYGNMWQSQTGLGSVAALAAMPTSSSQINAANNQVTSGGIGYDGTDGNQTTFLGVTMYYDAEQRLVQSSNSVSGNTYFYSYDGLGQRVAKTLGGGATTYYLHDMSGSVAVEYNSQTSAPCSTCYLSGDHLGSTRMVTDQSGSIVARHDYLPFGVEIPSGVAGRTGSWSVTDGLSPKFTGQDRDPEILLDYFYARNLANGLGRFMSPDPGNAGADASDPQTWNMYSYVRNNPLRYIDPTGLDCDDPSDESGDCDDGGNDGNGGWFSTWGGQNTVDPPSPPSPTVVFVANVTVRTASFVQQVAPVVQALFRFFTAPRRIGCLAGSTVAGSMTGAAVGAGGVVVAGTGEIVTVPAGGMLGGLAGWSHGMISCMSPVTPGQASSGAQDKKLSQGEIRKLESSTGESAHQIKAEALGTNKNIAQYDLYKDAAGNVVVKAKGGIGEAIPTGLTIN